MDIEHVRNVFMSYSTTEDDAIRQSSLKVLFKALGLSDEEKETFQKSREAKTQQ